MSHLYIKCGLSLKTDQRHSQLVYTLDFEAIQYMYSNWHMHAHAGTSTLNSTIISVGSRL